MTREQLAVAIAKTGLSQAIKVRATLALKPSWFRNSVVTQKLAYRTLESLTTWADTVEGRDFWANIRDTLRNIELGENEFYDVS